MNAQLATMPAFWKVFAYSVLTIGWLSVMWFVARYTSLAPWAGSEAGKHLVSMSVNVGAFFTLYLLLGLWPTMPYAGAVRFVLLLGIVANCVWRAVMFERLRYKDRRRERSGRL